MEADHLTAELTDQDRVLLVFGYLGPLALVSLVASRREFVKWHSKQGLALSVLLLGVYVALRPIHVFFDLYLWNVFGEVLRAAVGLALLGAGVVALMCIVRALEGERFKIPMLGDLVDKL